MRPQGRGGLLQAIGQPPGDTAWREDVSDPRHHALRPLQGLRADLDAQQQRAVGLPGCPPPGGRALQGLAGLVLAARTAFDSTQYGGHRVELALADEHVAEDRGREGLERLGRFPQPLEERVRIDRKHAGGRPNAYPPPPGTPAPARSAPSLLACHAKWCRDGPEKSRCIPVAALPPRAATGMPCTIRE